MKRKIQRAERLKPTLFLVTLIVEYYQYRYEHF